jgi:glyoxylase-like metal-dependent hydrolase (beta-lactamase superfamily II)
MRVHHLNAGSMMPLSAYLVNGQGGLFKRARLVCYILLIELRDGLMLVDTGLGLNDIAHKSALPSAFLKSAAPRLDPSETAIEQIRALRLAPDDVHHIVMTHLDLDHAGGLADFPKARVHLHRSEYQAAITGEIPAKPGRYRKHQWQHAPRWTLYDCFDDVWLGLPSARVNIGGEPDVRLVPLSGHTPGHSGVVVKTERGWLLHAGDSYYFRGQIMTPPQRTPLALEFFKRMADTDRGMRIISERRVRELRTVADLTIFCSHDPVEFERFSTASPTE